MEGLSRPICPTEWNLGFGLGANEIESGGRRDRGGGDESEEVSQISQRDFPPGWSHPPLSQNRPTNLLSHSFPASVIDSWTLWEEGTLTMPNGCSCAATCVSNIPTSF